MTSDPTGYLCVAPDTSPAAARIYDRDKETIGFVMNLSRIWAHLPEAHRQLFELFDHTADAAGLSFRDRGILVISCAVRRRDSYCALAWGNKLARHSGTDLAAAVLHGDDTTLTDAERALAGWARRVAEDPNGTTADDIEPLRAAGYDDSQIAAITVFLGLRIAFSTVNAALGINPDHELTAADSIAAAVDFGRPAATCA